VGFSSQALGFLGVSRESALTANAGLVSYHTLQIENHCSSDEIYIVGLSSEMATDKKNSPLVVAIACCLEPSQSNCNEIRVLAVICPLVLYIATRHIHYCRNEVIQTNGLHTDGHTRL
jgi:hypothetical protein